MKIQILYWCYCAVCHWVLCLLLCCGGTDQVIITQFGKPVGEPVTDAGLHFKVPFIQEVNRIEKRFLP